MDPIIYALPKTDNVIILDQKKFYFDQHPSPKLIKFGFNNIDYVINLVELMTRPEHRVGLNVDTERTDDLGLVGTASKYGITNFSPTFADIWEISALFGFLSKNQNIYMINDNNNIIQEISKLVAKNNVKWINHQTESKTGSKTKSHASLASPASLASLAIYRYSDI